MMQLDGTGFDGLFQRTVTVDGDWSRLPKRDWRGTAIADEALVAVTLLAFDKHIEWCKSDRSQTGDFVVRLLLGSYDSMGRDVQVAFSLASGDRRYRSMVASPTYVPEIVAPRKFQTGVIESFAVVDGDPTIHLLGLFLARSDVRSLRNGLWRVRDHLVDSLPEAFHGMLTYGRTGMLIGE
jgi:hypothetical protein